MLKQSGPTAFPSGRHGPSGVLGIWREELFIFRELRSTGNYFRHLGSKLIALKIEGALQKSKKINFKNLTLTEKPLFRLINEIKNLQHLEGSPPNPHCNIEMCLLSC